MNELRTELWAICGQGISSLRVLVFSHVSPEFTEYPRCFLRFGAILPNDVDMSLCVAMFCLLVDSEQIIDLIYVDAAFASRDAASHAGSAFDLCSSVHSSFLVFYWTFAPVGLLGISKYWCRVLTPAIFRTLCREQDLLPPAFEPASAGGDSLSFGCCVCVCVWRECECGCV